VVWVMGEETVPLSSGGDNNPVMGLDHAGEQTVVLLQSRFHRVRRGLPQARGTVDVGQQECDGPGRQVPRRSPSGCGFAMSQSLS
jgi:hypothetical protein